MKKILLASAALVAVASAAQAADPVKLSIGGYAVENFGYASNKASLCSTAQNRGCSSFDQQDDVVVSFAGTTKLDNGITVGVNVDTFGTQRADSRATASTTGNTNVKRSYVTVAGKFGAVIAGEREDVGYIVHNSAPDVGNIGLQDGSWFQWVVTPTNHRVYTATNASRYDQRGNKITYVTPAYAGFAAGVTYAPSIGRNVAGHTTIVDNNDGVNVAPGTTGSVNGMSFSGDLLVAGVAYAGEFSGVKVKADAGVGQASIANLRVYQGGTQVSYAGFTFGASILQREVPDSANVNNVIAGSGNVGAKTAAYAGQSFDVGLSYATGPASVSVGYFQDRSKDSVASGVLHSSGGKADSTRVYGLGAAYIVGPGVTLKSGLSYVDYKDGNGSNLATDKNRGVIAITGVKVDF